MSVVVASAGQLSEEINGPKDGEREITSLAGGENAAIDVETSINVNVGEDGEVDANLLPDQNIPQLASQGITEADLCTATRVLDAIAALDDRSRKKKRHRENGEDFKKKDSNTDGGGAPTSASEEADDGLALYRHQNLRPLRKALAKCYELHKRVLYNGKSEEEHYSDRLAERTLKRQKMAERVQQKDYIAKTLLRRGRIERLEKLKADSKGEVLEKLKMLVPDGHVETMVIERKESPLLLEDAANSAERGSPTNDDPQSAKSDPVTLPKLRSCYACKVRYRKLHHFYDQLCPACADLNFSKRHFSVSLANKVAVVTGSRVKIGFQTCLKLLRAGCTVVATTRFPNSAAQAYREERDFDQWKDCLHVYGLDLRDITGLEAFTHFLKARYGETGIDILINNACQTVRRPRGYYLPIVSREQEIWNGADETHKDILSGCIEFERLRRKLVVAHSQGAESITVGRTEETGDDVSLIRNRISHTAESRSLTDQVVEPSLNRAVYVTRPATNSNEIATVPDIGNNPFESTGLSHSAAMTQMIVLPEDVGVSSSLLPQGASDINRQQVDLRTSNSWLLKMDEVSTPEVMECMLINAIAPFVLNSRLKPLMTTPDDSARPNRYIINVSAMEGKFYRYKMPNHPHTNMAKAALNMLTRTSSEDLAKKHRIFMNSVDTGWINDENPLEKASKIAKTNLFQTPIDEIDAAARILDPIFVGVAADNDATLKRKKEYGKFYKDYSETEW